LNTLYELLLNTHGTYHVLFLAPEDETFEKVIGIVPREICIYYCLLKDDNLMIIKTLPKI
jgi:hypothetical protein